MHNVPGLTVLDRIVMYFVHNTETFQLVVYCLEELQHHTVPVPDDTCNDLMTGVKLSQLAVVHITGQIMNLCHSILNYFKLLWQLNCNVASMFYYYIG